MFRGNWRKRAKTLATITAIVVFYTMIVGSFFFDLGRYAPARQSSSASQSKAEHAQAEIRSFCVRKRSVSSGVECVYEKWSEYNKDTRERRDLHAQEYMAFWAKWMLIASVVTAAVTLGGVFLLWKDIATTRDIGQKQTRAYINVLSVEIRGNKDRSKIKIVGTINNSGQSPARNLRMSYRASIDPPPFSEEWHSEPDGYTSVGFLAGQAQSFIEHFLVGGSVGNDLVAEYNKTFTEGYEIWFYGIIRYDDVFGQSQQSRFRFQVDKSTIPAQFFACETGNEST